MREKFRAPRALHLMQSQSLTVLAFTMIAVFMALIMTKRMSVLTALILVPVGFAILAGFGRDLGPMMLDGVKALAPTAVMLLFAILFFSVMIDVGLFEPVVRRVVRLVQGDPLKIVVGTSILTLLVSLDGDGSTTYLIVTAALLPLYKRLGLSRLVLASVIMQAGGVMNILPWGGPTARAASALRIDASEIFVPMIPLSPVCSTSSCSNLSDVPIEQANRPRNSFCFSALRRSNLSALGNNTDPPPIVICGE